MHWGGTQGGLEVRQEGGATRISGRFPYAVPAELAPGLTEVIAAGAFAARVASGEDVHFLSGHNFEKPLASRRAGSLELRSAEDALSFTAVIASATSWARDFLAAFDGGLIRGLSPGFRVAKGGERITHDGNRTLRTITHADLIEISAVTIPAYPQAQLAARCWTPTERPVRVNAAQRWRA